MQVYYQPLAGEGVNFLDPDESRHATKVMRYQIGDHLRVTDGKGKFYDCILTEISKSSCLFTVSKVTSIPRRNFAITICVTPTKNMDRMEWFVEKAVEIGIERICFIQCKHAERKSVNLDRIKKKAISALKQSGQAWLPLLEDIQPMTSILKGDGQKYIAHVDPSNTKLLKDAAPASAYRVLIGPEGDFTQEEVEQATKAGFVKVSLGPNTLRTETAALVACHTLNLINQ